MSRNDLIALTYYKNNMKRKGKLMKKLKNLLLILALLVLAIIFLPNQAFAADDVFDKLLTDGKLVVHSIEPTSKEAAYTLVYENNIMQVDEKYSLDWETSFNSDFSKCTIYYCENQPGMIDENTPSKEVEISYVYDKDIKSVVDNLTKNIANKDTFSLNEIDFINYLLNQSEDSSMINYSSELKKALGYKNFYIDIRMGDDSPFLTERGGNSAFDYNGTTYYFKLATAQAKHIIYVDTDTTDVLAAIKTRLIKNFGQDFNVTEGGTIASFIDEERQMYIDSYADSTWAQTQYNSAEEYAQAMLNENYYKEGAYYSFVVSPEFYERYYELTINDIKYKFLVAKDSSKVNDNAALITSDVGSNVTISAETALIPFDTLIQVAKITNGSEYEKIIKILEVANSEMFDLKLYSNSIGEYITKLDNGKFEVKIPVSESLKGKDLVVYYVDENDKIVEYEVAIKDGYAVFETDHFSIYTLAEKGAKTTEETQKEEGKKDETPKTGTVDLIAYLGIAILISVCGIVIFKENK